MTLESSRIPIPHPLDRGWFVATALLTVMLVIGCSGPTGTGDVAVEDAPLTPLRGGSPTSLAAFHGKPVIVNFWAPWCTPCVKEMPAFEAVHRELGDSVVIVGITDSLDRVGSKRLAESTGVTYPLLVDDGGTLQTELGVVNLPTTVFLDAGGSVIRRHAGAFTPATLRKTIESLHADD